ncbi:Gfo/Idh/MocA family oxidoreductase [Compostibacter hankyongensis]|uniref:Gfo/Idh/MocA family oxidoreductase n=1 Tax=Compostibacter hankyongensis TaxID=1007089 RepID=A0ABP8FCU0_9BACT
MTPPDPQTLPRRTFIRNASLAAAGFYIVPRHVLGRGYTAPSDKLNIAAIGSGGKGKDNIQKAWNNGAENIAALCDVDDRQAAAMFKKFPKAPRYKDFRVMLEKEHRNIDAVIIATPDHTHTVATLAAMQSGKHVYTQKPLTHDIYEARELTRAAARYPKLVTQMGNQGSSGDDTRNVEAWVQAGLIGPVHRVHCWTNRPVWPQGLPTPKEKQAVPPELDWNLWLGTAPQRDYNSAYLPFNWRGWWDYGTGALGDMACHIMDVPFRALQLQYPTEVQCSVGSVYSDFFQEDYHMDSCPPSSVIYLQFPERKAPAGWKINLPAVEVIWYDGGILPRRPDELLPDEQMGDWDGGVIFEGSKGKIMTGMWGMKPTLLPTRRMKEADLPSPTRPLVPRGADGHETQWVEACKKGDPKAVSSPFSQAGPLTEMVLMGNLAIRSYMYHEEGTIESEGGIKSTGTIFPGRKKLLWDGEAMRITNFDAANRYVKRTYRGEWNS